MGSSPLAVLDNSSCIHTAMPYINFMQVVIETPDYLTDAKALGLLEDERRAIVNYVAQYPHSGDEMKGTGGAVKKPIYRKRKEMN